VPSCKRWTAASWSASSAKSASFIAPGKSACARRRPNEGLPQAGKQAYRGSPAAHACLLPARSPKDKLKIVQAFQNIGHVVAMTGAHSNAATGAACEQPVWPTSQLAALLCLCNALCCRRRCQRCACA